MSLAVEQDSSLMQDRLASLENFRAMSSLNEVSGIPKLIEKDARSSAPVVGFGVSLNITVSGDLCVTLKRSERRLRQWRHFLMILELFATFDRNFLAARLSEKIEIRVKRTLYAGFHCAAR